MTYLRFELLVLAALLVGCPKKTPPAESTSPPTASSAEAAPASSSPASASASDNAKGASEAAGEDNATISALCVKAYENLLKVNGEGDAPPLVLQRIKRGKSSFLTRCAGEDEAVTRCIATAKDRVAAGSCKSPRRAGAEQLEELCKKAYAHARAILAKEGAPDDVLQRMDDRREDAEKECMREQPETVQCLLAADSSLGFESCKRFGTPTPKAADPKHLAACKAAFANLIAVVKPGKDMPPKAYESMKANPAKFELRCLSGDLAMAGCVAEAETWKAIRACRPAEPPKPPNLPVPPVPVPAKPAPAPK